MAEHGDVVAGLVHIRGAPGVNAAVVAFLLVDIRVQVEIGVVGGLENRLVELGALNLDPAHRVGILPIEHVVAGAWRWDPWFPWAR